MTRPVGQGTFKEPRPVGQGTFKEPRRVGQGTFKEPRRVGQGTFKEPRPLAVLIGSPGSGKTTVGMALAERLSVGFRDTDADVEAVAGKPVSEIFIDDGEARFRELEREAVRAALAGFDGVLALGGGAVLAEQTQALLAGHTVVYLEVGLAVAVQRVGLAAARPLLVINPRSVLKKLLEERRPVYERLATITVSTGDREPAALVDEIVKELP